MLIVQSLVTFYISASWNHRALAWYNVLLSACGPSIVLYIQANRNNDKRLILLVGPQLKKNLLLGILRNYVAFFS